MSGDVTDKLPPDGQRDTAPILEQIVAELRALREDSHATRIAVEELGARMDRLISETRAGFRRELGADVDLIHSRLDRLEADVRALRGAQT
jgi:hypothetical protein